MCHINPGQKQLNRNTMKNLLYFVAVILIIAWAVGLFAFNAGSMVHILLLVAIVSLLIKVVQGDKIIHYQSHKII
jgi:hypothetical protein